MDLSIFPPNISLKKDLPRLSIDQCDYFKTHFSTSWLYTKKENHTSSYCLRSFNVNQRYWKWNLELLVGKAYCAL